MPSTSRSHRPDAYPSPRRGSAREHAILDAAVQLLAETGYERITVDQIAARAGASKATMYRRWPSKAELVGDALRRHAESGSPRATDTGSLRGDLIAAVDGMTRSITGRDGPALLGLVEAVRDHADLRAVVRDQIHAACRGYATAILTQAVERDELATVPGNAADILMLAIGQLLFETLMSGRRPTPAARARLTDDVLLPLLKGGSAARSAS